jgi:hypothetical protein
LNKSKSPFFTQLANATISNEFLKNLPNDSIKFSLIMSKCFVDLFYVSKRLDPNSVLELEAAGDFEVIEE